MEVDSNNSNNSNNKFLKYEEVMLQPPEQVVKILIDKINAQQHEISGLWNRLRKNKPK
jgi:hypothetical protein